MLNLDTFGTYNYSLLLGKLYNNIDILTTIKNEMKNEFLRHCKGKYQQPVFFSNFLGDLLIVQEATTDIKLGAVLT